MPAAALSPSRRGRQILSIDGLTGDLVMVTLREKLLVGTAAFPGSGEIVAFPVPKSVAEVRPRQEISRYHRDQLEGIESWSREGMIASVRDLAHRADLQDALIAGLTRLNASVVKVGKQVEGHCVGLMVVIDIATKSMNAASHLSQPEQLPKRESFHEIARTLLNDQMSNPLPAVEWPNTDDFSLPTDQRGG